MKILAIIVVAFAAYAIVQIWRNKKHKKKWYQIFRPMANRDSIGGGGVSDPTGNG